MNIDKCYSTLRVTSSSTNEEITRSFKKLALQYHPDRNRDRTEWANNAMTSLNLAYTSLMAFRFKNEKIQNKKQGKSSPTPKQPRPAPGKKVKPADRYQTDREYLIRRFIKLRESSKDSLYRYFQYNLYNLHRRENIHNTGIFNEIVLSLRKYYHGIKSLEAHTDDPELLEHFSVFTAMIFQFYRASECLNILDTYSNTIDVEAYRLYRAGDDSLHRAGKEIFYDRHNRGFIKKDIAYGPILDSELILKKTLAAYPGSTWAVETGIKLEYAVALKRYFELFFLEDEEEAAI